MKPQRVVHELNGRLAAMPSSPPIADTTPAYRAVHPHPRAAAFAVSGTLASMGGGLPYAIAAAFAFPAGRWSPSSATAACR